MDRNKVNVGDKIVCPNMLNGLIVFAFSKPHHHHDAELERCHHQQPTDTQANPSVLIFGEGPIPPVAGSAIETGFFLCM